MRITLCLPNICSTCKYAGDSFTDGSFHCKAKDIYLEEDDVHGCDDDWEKDTSFEEGEDCE